MKTIYLVENNDEYDTTYIGFKSKEDATKYQKDLKFYGADSDYQELYEITVLDDEYKFPQDLTPVVTCTIDSRNTQPLIIDIRTKNVRYYNVERLKANDNVIITNSTPFDKIDFLFPRNGNENYNTFLKRAKKEAIRLYKTKRE